MEQEEKLKTAGISMGSDFLNGKAVSYLESAYLAGACRLSLFVNE
ncbi:hypothetical protein [Halobacillus shinanisalinarum]|nr:hypothetical protein [Halobacillus shinanisalinarum]